jgi:hypothetical protein
MTLVLRYMIDRSARRVTLTFDNGPHALIKPPVLDCLGTHEVKETFFVIGEKVSLPQEGAIARRLEPKVIGSAITPIRIPILSVSSMRREQSKSLRERKKRYLGLSNPCGFFVHTDVPEGSVRTCSVLQS